MTDRPTSFPAGIDFESVLRIISKQIYETPLAFIRENVQNAVDAVRIQAYRERIDSSDERYRIDIDLGGKEVRVRDNGIGMTPAELASLFWTIGASGKRTPEAAAAGCVGTFGIGGFANFGVCEKLEVISKTEDATHGTLTRLSEADIRNAGASIPSVTVELSDASAPRGTIVVGYLRSNADIDQLRRYLRDFVRFVPIAIYFNGDKVSQGKFSDLDHKDNLREVSTAPQEWGEGNLSVTGRLYEDRGHTLVASITGMKVGSEQINLSGQVRFEAGAFDVFKRGFKLCATSVPTIIGISGRLDCDRFTPTAGRDSLDSATTSLLGQIAQLLERVAVETVLQSPERIAQHTRIFRYVVKRGLIDKVGRVQVNLADGSESTLGDIRRRATSGGVSVYFGTAQKQALNQIMQARGHIVVLLSADAYRRDAERRYLEQFCAAKAFDGMIDIVDHYEDLSRFEKVFLSELELSITKSYEVRSLRLTPGKLTEDIPVFIREPGGNQSLDILVDVRHPEIAKLQELGYTPILYSLISTFCHEYLGPSLKRWSPRFFGDGALNLDLLSRRRSELWVLLKDDIGVVRKGGQRQVVTRSDVHVVNVGAGQSAPPQSEPGKPKPRILQIVDDQGATGLGGFYVRLPDSAFCAYGDLLPECESRGVVWAGNKIEYVISDTVSAAFKYEIRLDEVVATVINGSTRAEGAVQLKRPLQEMYGGLYFPIPATLERFLVPRGDIEIRLELYCDWFDIRTAKHWGPKDLVASS
jgi:molecular chaperone HtpG